MLQHRSASDVLLREDFSHSHLILTLLILPETRSCCSNMPPCLRTSGSLQQYPTNLKHSWATKVACRATCISWTANVNPSPLARTPSQVPHSEGTAFCQVRSRNRMLHFVLHYARNSNEHQAAICVTDQITLRKYRATQPKNTC